MTVGRVVSPWFVRPPSTDHPARLFCLPFAGAGASAYSAWPVAIGDAEVCPVQFPGRENRLGDPHYGTFDRLAADLVTALEPLLDRPYAFFGHCAGALPAYETVLRLAELGLPGPARLFVSGQPAPHDAGRDRMLAMTESQLRDELITLLRDRGFDPRPDMIEMGMSVLLPDHAAARAYHRVPPVPIRCPIVVLHWAGDPVVTRDDLRGWHRYSDVVDTRTIPGGRYDFMLASEKLQDVLIGWHAAEPTR
jgi:surfactin synthase thioesterase subunit